LSPFDSSKKILLVGDVFVDYHLDRRLLRLGGIFHAVRALHATGAQYGAAQILPSYLRADAARFLRDLACQDARVVADVTGAPSVMLVAESTEAGDQGYIDILRDQRRVEWDAASFDGVLRSGYTDALVFPGDYPVEQVISTLLESGVRVHVDAQYFVDLRGMLSRARSAVETVFVSTTSPAFRQDAGGSPERLRDTLIERARTVVLKENRGGARAWSRTGDAETGAYPTKTAHSVGVGDCFDAVWIASREDLMARARLGRASFYASLYASTFDHRAFVADVATAIAADAEVAAVKGLRLPWEDRAAKHIYIAAPDFPHIDTKVLDQLEAALRYHNFSPHRPVKENGFGAGRADAEKQKMYAADLALLERCELLIAVPLTEDAGTFVELGMHAAAGRPSILLDVNGMVDNLFATRSATQRCTSVAQAIDATFKLLGRNV
jgi:nucleoside 2-deoxyribosyltransferase